MARRLAKHGLLECTALCTVTKAIVLLLTHRSCTSALQKGSGSMLKWKERKNLLFPIVPVSSQFSAIRNLTVLFQRPCRVILYSLSFGKL